MSSTTRQERDARAAFEIGRGPRCLRRDDRGYHEQYPRLYRALKSQGHTAAKAIEILIEARRRDRHSLDWCRMIAKLARRQ